MQYKIFKLKFETPVHFGSEKVGTSLENTNIICHSDTLFSAMCQEILKLYDEVVLLDFVDTVEDGELLFSSLLPYNGNNLFLPKPCLLLERTNNNENTTSSSVKKKKMKKLEYISINDFQKYIDYLKIGNNFDYDEELYKFCETNATAKVSLNTDSDKNNIYYVGGTYFKNECGLYVLVAYNNDEQIELFERVLTSLGYSGIGGKRSSGYGKFNIEDEMYPDADGLEEEKLLYSLLEGNSDYQETLSVVSPSDEELDNNDFDEAFYKLISRNGYVYSTTYTDENTLVKRKSLAMFKEGSCFPFEIKGEIKDVSDNGKHPVYKNGKCLKIGVKL